MYYSVPAPLDFKPLLMIIKHINLLLLYHKHGATSQVLVSIVNLVFSKRLAKK
jgi:hypothetical protein